MRTVTRFNNANLQDLLARPVTSKADETLKILRGYAEPIDEKATAQWIENQCNKQPKDSPLMLSIDLLDPYLDLQRRQARNS